MNHTLPYQSSICHLTRPLLDTVIKKFPGQRNGLVISSHLTVNLWQNLTIQNAAGDIWLSQSCTQRTFCLIQPLHHKTLSKIWMQDFLRDSSQFPFIILSESALTTMSSIFDLSGGIMIKWVRITKSISRSNTVNMQHPNKPLGSRLVGQHSSRYACLQRRLCASNLSAPITSRH